MIDLLSTIKNKEKPRDLLGFANKVLSNLIYFNPRFTSI